MEHEDNYHEVSIYCRAMSWLVLMGLVVWWGVRCYFGTSRAAEGIVSGAGS